MILDLPKTKLLEIYEKMLKIRIFEENIAENLLKKPSKINCPCHLYTGQEAVAVGICSNLKRKDYVFGTHRSHGVYIAKGGNLNTIMAEIYGKETGCCKGRGGSMHVIDKNIGIMGTSAIVANSISLAAGTALASKIKKENRVSVAFFGDGAVNEGVIFETINFAVLRKLPIIFVCENNLYATHVKIKDHLSNINISELIKGFKIKTMRCKGNDVLDVYNTGKKLINNVRQGLGPVFIECLTYRYRGHVGPHFDIDKGLRTQKELDIWIKKCPIKKLEKHLKTNKIVNKEEIKIINKNVEKQVKNAIKFAEDSNNPDPKTVSDYVYS